MNQGMQDDFKRDGFISQLMTRLARLEAFEREFRLKQFGGGMFLVEDQLLAAPAASFSFTTLPSIGKHLQIKTYLRSDRVAVFDFVMLQYNGDAAANYDYFGRQANNAASTGFELYAQTQAQITACAGNNSTAGLFSTAELFVNNYNGTTGHKQAQGRGEDEELAAAGNFWQYDIHHRWASSNAITSIYIFSGTGSNFVTGSRISVYAWL